MNRMIKSALCAVTAIPLLWSSVGVAQERFRCAPSPIVPVDKDYGPPDGWNYNRDLVGLRYGLYAAASYDAYEPDGTRPPRDFSIADNDSRLSTGRRTSGKTGWNIAKDFQNDGRVSHDNGLSFDVYTKNQGGDLHVLVAYRGTDSWINPDGIANFSWFTQWINPWDQYRDARNEFSKVIDYAVNKANGRRIAFVATGHSLGGGLAQHVAHVHFCVSAIVFNSSPVTNEVLFGNHTPPVVIRVYEDNDLTNSVVRLLPRGDNAKTRALYIMNGSATAANQHNMEALAAAMLRTPLNCVAKWPDCVLKRPDVQEAVLLYCERYRNRRKMPTDDVCTRAAY